MIPSRTGTSFKGGIASTSQSMVERMEKLSGIDKVPSSAAQVVAVYANTMTCDVITSNGMTITNVPIMSKCGLIEDEVFGEMELPAIDSYVIVMFLGDRESFPIIIGTIFPYNNKFFQDSQTPVNSADKQFTLKLLEDVDNKTFRKIFKSGTSVEVQDDGTLIVETPDGTYLKIDVTGTETIFEDSNGNIVTIGGSGMKLEDMNGNILEMGSSSVKINNNLEVLQ